MGIGELEGDLSDELEKLRVLSLEFEELTQGWLTVNLLCDPTIDDLVGDTMILGCFGNRDSVVLGYG